VKRIVVTVIGLGLIAVGAVFFGGNVLKPAAERTERDRSVLTGLHQPKLAECRFLEDSELPEGVARPAVGEDWQYLRIVVLYPAAAKAPEPKEHRLEPIGGILRELEPAVAETDVDEEVGAYVSLIFRVDADFGSGKLKRGDAVVLTEVSPE